MKPVDTILVLCKKRVQGAVSRPRIIIIITFAKNVFGLASPIASIIDMITSSYNKV